MEHLRNADSGTRLATLAGTFTVIRYVSVLDKVEIRWDRYPDVKAFMDGGALLCFMAYRNIQNKTH